MEAQMKIFTASDFRFLMCMMPLAHSKRKAQAPFLKNSYVKHCTCVGSTPVIPLGDIVSRLADDSGMSFPRRF